MSGAGIGFDMDTKTIKDMWIHAGSYASVKLKGLKIALTLRVFQNPFLVL